MNPEVMGQRPPVQLFHGHFFLGGRILMSMCVDCDLHFRSWNLDVLTCLPVSQV